MDIIGYLVIIVGIISIIKNYNKYIIVLINLELILIGVSILFLYFGILFDDLGGYTNTLFLLVISAAEAAIGLTLLVFYTSIPEGPNFKVIRSLNPNRRDIIYILKDKK